MVGPSKQASIHTHMRNEVTLVWGSLRLAPIKGPTPSFAELPSFRVNSEFYLTGHFAFRVG